MSPYRTPGELVPSLPSSSPFTGFNAVKLFLLHKLPRWLCKDPHVVCHRQDHRYWFVEVCLWCQYTRVTRKTRHSLYRVHRAINCDECAEDCAACLADLEEYVDAQVELDNIRVFTHPNEVIRCP